MNESSFPSSGFGVGFLNISSVVSVSLSCTGVSIFGTLSDSDGIGLLSGKGRQSSETDVETQVSILRVAG